MPCSHEHLTTLYWTVGYGMPTVHPLMKKIAALFLACSTALWMAHSHAGQAQAVSADDAQNAVAQGAYVLDVRSAEACLQAHLPQAACLPSHAAQWPLQQLAQLLSQAGIDSSRTMLVVGDAGDANAQALWERLTQVTAGRVLWLVGGVQEWQMRGHALTAAASARPRVPQFLAPFAPSADAPAHTSRMAGSRVRTSALLERDVPFRVALN